MRYKNFKHLPKIETQSNIPDQMKSQARPQSDPKTDKELFHKAMQDVKPLKNKGHGRQITAPASCKEKSLQTETEISPYQYLQDLVHGKFEFEIELTTEYLQGNVQGLDPRIFRKLKNGQYSPEAHLDLHGLKSEDARIALTFFIKEHYLNGKRCLLVIPGRGKNSLHGRSILRESIQMWLTQEPLKRVVLGFSTAKPQHGGTGALYILLRKYKKSRGKIVWERALLENDL
ncbi:MAG TPA: Smr/MutS family protein [Desulfohalobiaceae bacterium]|nr:Smr/MutS family protein [Desulfohalobiaceae bacterium]